MVDIGGISEDNKGPDIKKDVEKMVQVIKLINVMVWINGIIPNPEIHENEAPDYGINNDIYKAVLDFIKISLTLDVHIDFHEPITAIKENNSTFNIIIEHLT